MSTNYETGWLNDPALVEAETKLLPFPLAASCNQAIRGSGSGKTVLLYKNVEEINGAFNLRRQLGPDCTSVAMAGAIDHLKAFEIKILGQPELWTGETCSEDIYGGSRVQIGKNKLGRGGGSYGVWTARYVSEIGTLVRKAYGKYDLSKYNWNIANVWDTAGVPSELLDIAREHPVQTVTKVSTIDEAKDFIANGYPITIAGNYGFSSTRDKYGFARRSGSWAHQLYLSAVDDVGVESNGRKGFLCQNSWGKWNNGPKRLGQPDGSFWMYYEDVQRYLNGGDCWAISDFDGFKQKKLDLWII